MQLLVTGMVAITWRAVSDGLLPLPGRRGRGNAGSTGALGAVAAAGHTDEACTGPEAGLASKVPSRGAAGSALAARCLRPDTAPGPELLGTACKALGVEHLQPLDLALSPGGAGNLHKDDGGRWRMPDAFAKAPARQHSDVALWSSRFMSPRKSPSPQIQAAQPQLWLASLLREALASMAASASVADRLAAAGTHDSHRASPSSRSSFGSSLSGLVRQSFDAGPQDAEPHTPRATEPAAHRSSSSSEQVQELEADDALEAPVCGPRPRSRRLPPLEGALRRRFCAQVQRGVLRIRITGADPDQLPCEWRELVAAHFSGESV